MIQVFENTDNLNTQLADLFVEKATNAIKTKGKFTVALTGGSSPAELHRLLASDAYKNKINWNKVFVFWGDERWVPLNDEKSNAGAAIKNFLNHIPIPKENIFPMWKEGIEPQVYAKEYEAILEDHLELGDIFDLIILGMGDDGHTASLFPNQEIILKEKEKKVAAYFLAPQDMYRITLTVPLINKAKQIVFIVFGEKKSNALYEVLQGERNSNLYPSQLINEDDGNVTWMVDKAAASKLSL
ncbi:6-phosphogluconolactonase [Galbibacter orientalis DSM 19592]|uniref:6-phosphogluconolactonase n=1 Tax=Galbibacter orientalis DSM 19592 TaxID=926559 RepID=I3C8N1_9FLAO|nr:6-phosphogluconolactonase [Galbibacter orientalis]EIJ39974.1 6-phosphogluconolactonase [Galbibacter orientalis DSM 19592]